MTNPSPSSAVVSLIHHFQAHCGQLAVTVERHLHLGCLLPHLQANRGTPGPSGVPAPLLAVAQDQAFCFLYPEQREWLEYWDARTQA